MIAIKGYTTIEYDKLQEALRQAYLKSGKTLMQVAYNSNIGSVTSVANALGKTKAPVSDAMFSIVMKDLDLPGVILFDQGEKKCFIKESYAKKHQLVSL